MKIWSAITLLSAVLYTASASDVISLKNKSEFDQTIAGHDLVLVNFQSADCIECEDLRVSFDKAATLLKDEAVVADIDCDLQPLICKRYNIRSYPTVRMFRNGRPSNLLLDITDEYSITNFVRSELDSVLVELYNKEDLEGLREKEPLVVVAYVSPEDRKTIDLWKTFSEKLRDDFAFGLVTDKALAESEHTSSPSIVLYKRFDAQRDVYTGPLDTESIEDFIKVNAVPLLATIEPSTFMDYVDAGRPLAYIFSDTPEVQDQMQDLFYPLAQKYRGDFSFVHINATDYASQADFLVLKENKWPALAIHNFKTGARFPFDQTKSLTEQDVVSFLEQVKKNELKPAIRSQAFPVRQPDDPVEVVVGLDFEDIVMDPSKDVLLEVYAPWCGHCRSLAPIYQQLGQVVKEKGGDVLIAKMDGTVNDIPLSAGFSVSAYPTIKLIKAGTNEVIDYDGERTLVGFAEFLNQYATDQSFKIDISLLPKEKVEDVKISYQEKHDEL